MIGFAKAFIGRGAESEAHIQQAFRLSPRDSGAYRWMHWLGVAKLILGADAEAVDWLRRCLEANWNYTIVHFQLAAALALVGSLDEARASARAGACARSGLHHTPDARAHTTHRSNISCRKWTYPRWHADGRGAGGVMSPLGQSQKSSIRAHVFRFAPESGHCDTRSARPFRANRRHGPPA